MRLMAVLLALALIPIAGLVYQLAGSWRDARRFPVPGKIFRGLHLVRSGEGAPAVVLEAGIAGSSLGWKLVEQRVAQFAEVVSYDRAGLGWSEPAAGERSLSNIVNELRELLCAAGVPGPWVLVGHSFGALVVRWFAAQHPGEVAALVLVDPVPIADWCPLTEEQEQRLARGMKLSRRGAWLARFGVVRLALASLLAGSHALPRLMSRLGGGRGAKVTGNLAREAAKLPREAWPLVSMHWRQPKCFRAMAEYLSALPANAEAAAGAKLPEGLPIIVLAADYSKTDMISGALYRRVEGSGHWIQLDHPDAVVDAIRDAVTFSRQRSRARPEESGASAAEDRAPKDGPPMPKSQ